MSLSDVKGRIFNIQRFSVHDGPGIRTIVFLKGCVLRCRWCCNPESQSYKIETMLQDGKEKTVGKDISVGEVMQTVRKDMPYYRRSGGGLTLSGGEVLCQGEFSLALLKQAKSEGINTAVESAASVSYDVIEKVLPYIDVYLCDVKHIDAQKHKEFCGRGNELILENVKRLSKEANRLIIRVPVIPSFNDTKEEIAQIAKFAASCENVREMHLLPYHNFGSDKYKYLGRKYLMEDIVSPTAAHMQHLADEAAKYGIKVQIGG